MAMGGATGEGYESHSGSEGRSVYCVGGVFKMKERLAGETGERFVVPAIAGREGDGGRRGMLR